MGGQRRQVVVIGGSFAGRRAARQLRPHFDVTIVDAKGFFEYTPAALRCMVHPEHATNVLLPQPEGTVVATATDITAPAGLGGKGHVTLSDGQQLSFDYCVVATGSSYSNPIKPDMTIPASVATRTAQFKAESQKLSAAERIVIVGGGTVGVELAAEIVGRWRNKVVTLVASQRRLLERMPEGASKYAYKWLTARDVEVVLGERIEDWGEEGVDAEGRRVLVTSQARQLPADLVYRCIGFRACGDVVSSLLGADGLEGARSRVPVSRTLQVGSSGVIFAAGDCTNTTEEKNALNADLGASCVVENILRLSRGRTDLLTFPEGVCHGSMASPDIACVSLYKYHASMQFNRLVINGRLPVLIKNMVEMFQMLVAKESWLGNLLWNMIEATNILLGSFLFWGRDICLQI
mmetsp:Transcript_21440/g.54996  ORF Transcript_21440/g.54996 Transcript_21440/m.54996 type:complete len:406 (+) Transcript_21440:177-1394(+)